MSATPRTKTIKSRFASVALGVTAMAAVATTVFAGTVPARKNVGAHEASIPPAGCMIANTGFDVCACMDEKTGFKGWSVDIDRADSPGGVTAFWLYPVRLENDPSANLIQVVTEADKKSSAVSAHWLLRIDGRESDSSIDFDSSPTTSFYSTKPDDVDFDNGDPVPRIPPTEGEKTIMNAAVICARGALPPMVR